MDKNQLKYTLKEIKKANLLSELIFDYLYKLKDKKKLSKTIYRITQINEILSNIEINIEMILGIDKDSLGDENK